MHIRRWEVVPVDRDGNAIPHPVTPRIRYFTKAAAKRTVKARNRMQRVFKRNDMFRLLDRKYNRWA